MWGEEWRGASMQGVREREREKQRQRRAERETPPRNPHLVPLGHQAKVVKGKRERATVWVGGIQHLPFFNS